MSVVVGQRQLEDDEDALAKKEGDLEARQVSAKVHIYVYIYIYYIIYVYNL